MNKNLSQMIELINITGTSTGCGWLHDEPAKLLQAIINYSKPEIVIQTGHLWGKSALIILQSLDEMYTEQVEVQNAHALFESFVKTNTPSRPSNPPILHSIDPYCLHVPNAKKGIDYLEINYPNFKFFFTKSSDYFKNISFDKSKRIMGFVDGDHSYLGAYEDMVNLALLKAQVIVLDDTSWIPYLKRAAIRIARIYDYSMSEFPYYNGTIILTKKNELKSPFSNKWTSLIYEMICTVFGLSFALLLKRLVHIVKIKH